jgi:hypothetical protein
MATDPITLPVYARPPGSGPTPKGVIYDAGTSFKMAKQLFKAVRTKGKSKSRVVHRAKPDKASKR